MELEWKPIYQDVCERAWESTIPFHASPGSLTAQQRAQELSSLCDTWGQLLYA
jgi:hypothetical protein